MSFNTLKSLVMPKYERLLPRLFPGAVRIEIRDLQGAAFWTIGEATSANTGEPDDATTESAAWAEFCAGVSRRQLENGEVQFRMAMFSRSQGEFACLVVTFDTRQGIPLTTAAEPLRRAFVDASAFLQEEIELQSECNLLAAELTERYEELNLVYSTKEVEYFDERQDALARLVQNCVEYLDVGLAALICRDRGLALHHASVAKARLDVEQVLEHLGAAVYDRVEAQVSCVVVNNDDDDERALALPGRSENLLAYPILDDHGTAIGLLAVVASRNAHTFSNGDRNLLEVMAKKASRIIHTHHDSLTGLMNRGGFEASLVATLSAARSNNLQHFLLHIDVDQLHVVNDLMGYQEGDNLIRRVAKVLRGSLRDTDYIARLGSDEFAALLCNCTTTQAHEIAEKVRDSIRRLSVVSARRQLDVSASIGLASLNSDTDGIVGVMGSAEIACKAAKDAGRDCVQVFEEDDTTLVRRSVEIEWIGMVQQALREDEFVLYCQPVMPLADESQPEHFEVLVRMRGEDGELLLPGSFMPAAERYQLMPMIDRWIIRETLNSLGASWSTIAATRPVFCINLSGQSLTNAGFQAFVIDELNQSGIPPENICFEITETAAISNIDEATKFMNALRKIGCRFSLDDFGAGLSSFGYLKVLPVDYLKIDGSFVREMSIDEVSLSMVKAIYQIGRTMGLSTVAEFVENQDTTNLLRQIGVDYVQGFGIGKPVPLVQILQGLQSKASAATA